MQDFIDKMIHHVKQNARERAERTLAMMTAPVVRIPGSFEEVRMSVSSSDRAKYCVAQEDAAVHRLMQKLVLMSDPPDSQ